MYLTGIYDMQWGSSEMILVNLSSLEQEYSIKFFDSNGGVVYETKRDKVKPFGSKLIELVKIRELKRQKGLVIIQCNSGIRCEFRYRADDGPLRTSVPFKEGMPPFSLEGITIFISFAMQEKNNNLYELVSRLLKALGFTVLSAKETGRADLSPSTQASDLIGQSNALLAILTKDIKSDKNGQEVFYSSQNVIDEIGQATNKPVIIIAEEKVEIPSNIQMRATYLTFSHKRMEEMLVGLTEALKKIKLI